MWYTGLENGAGKMINVVAGIIYRDDGKFLIAQRNLNKNQGGLWEFPGGKLEPGETCEEALAREIREEMAADIEVLECVGENIHHYPEKDIRLMFYKAKLLSDDVTLLEHEDCRWITKEDKDKFEFAGADVKVFEMI